jgi:hypothetical protein
MANQASSANAVTAANLELATEFAEYFVREGKNVAIMVPDYEELDNIEVRTGLLYYSFPMLFLLIWVSRYSFVGLVSARARMSPSWCPTMRSSITSR